MRVLALVLALLPRKREYKGRYQPMLIGQRYGKLRLVTVTSPGSSGDFTVSHNGIARSFTSLILAVLFSVGAICLWALSAIAHAADEPLAFKGLEMGSTEEQVKSKYPKITCTGEQSRSCMLLPDKYERARVLDDCMKRGSGAEQCFAVAAEKTGSETIAGIGVEHIFFNFYDGLLGRISIGIPSTGFERASIALLDSLGKATSDATESVQTKAGASYEDRTLQWVSRAGTITARRYSGSISSSNITYLSPAGMARAAQDAAAARKKAAKDL